MSMQKKLSRRDFVHTTFGDGLGLGFPAVLGTRAQAAGRVFKVGLIGCGGRGRGAAVGSLEAGKILGFDVRIVATADYFRDRAVRAGQQLGVPEDKCFGGADCYRKLLETDAEIVLMATAPLFRPLHIEAAIKAGKNVFVEKPVAVDPPGCRRVIAAGELAERKGLVITAGTEMRHEFNRRKTHQAIVVEKQLGRLYAGRVSFCIGHMFWRKPIEPKTPDDLVRSWQNWISLSGDHLVEQHVHNIDIANWFADRPPVSAVGFGCRGRRPAGDMYDFFSIDYDYGDGVHIHSMCRQINGCWNWVGHDFAYEKGHTDGGDRPQCRHSPIPPDLPQAPSAHIQEQVDTLYHVNKGKGWNEARAVAESTATAVMGRMSAYTGKQVTWKQIMTDPNAQPDYYHHTLKPTAEDFEKGTVQIPPETIPLPGVKA